MTKTVKVSFLLPAEIVGEATQAKLIGEFNAWNTDEALAFPRGAAGHIEAVLELMPGQSYQYKYLLSDGRWVTDRGEKAFTEVHGHVVENSIVFVPVEIIETGTEGHNAETNAKKPVKAKAEPKAKESKPVKTAQDDLTKIEGISKPVEKLLHHAGIATFEQLSKATDKKLRGILDSEGDKYKSRKTTHWAEGAKLAMEGKWEALAALGGKKKK